jgi:hypothetical protein
MFIAGSRKEIECVETIVMKFIGTIVIIFIDTGYKMM